MLTYSILATAVMPPPPPVDATEIFMILKGMSSRATGSHGPNANDGHRSKDGYRSKGNTTSPLLTPRERLAIRGLGDQWFEAEETASDAG